MGAGKIVKVAGPLVVAEGMPDARMYDVVKVSSEELIGEIVEIKPLKFSLEDYLVESLAGTSEEKTEVSSGEKDKVHVLST